MKGDFNMGDNYEQFFDKVDELRDLVDRVERGFESTDSDGIRKALASLENLAGSREWDELLYQMEKDAEN